MKRLFLLALAPLLAPLLAPAASGATGVKIKEIDALNSPLIINEDKIVRFTGDVSYTAADYKSAIEVTNCTVVLDIPAGVTVSLGGGNAKGQNGAGAGIRVAPDATLVITGGGTLEVSGGMAADGTSGLDAVKPYTQDDHDAVPGQGGKGGTGGGGAAAAIGGNGGAGSDGGDYTVKEGDYGWSGGSANGTRKGVDGNSSANGVDGADCGKVYILGRVTVKTKVDTQGGTGGSGGKATNAAVDGKSSRNHAGYGGGGGGGGGGGCGCSDLYKVARCGIGGGAGGGAGGGSGGGGASYQNGKNSGPDKEITEKAGFGRGGEGGNGSGKGVDGDFYPAATYKEDVNNSDDGYRTQPVAAYSDGSCDGGAAGKAGLSGNKGADGTLIVGRAVSLSVSNGGNLSLSFNDKNREDFSAVDADVQAMLETSMVVNATNGTEIATITFYLGEPLADLSDETLAALCLAIPNNADACFDGLMTADGSDLYDAEGRVCREVVGSYEFARTPLKIRLAPKGEGIMVDRGDDKGRRDARSFFGSKGKVAYDSGTHELVIKDGSVTLSGKSVEGRSLKIAVEKGAGKIVFDNLNLSVSNDLTNAIEVHADVTIALKGTNVVSAAKGSGIAVASSATLTIGRDEGLAHEQAQLWVSTTDGAPAIGTDVNGSSGIVCIKGGQITATGGNTAPAIGSVSGGGMIQINGGLITANATPGSTALGGSGVKFEVSGGSVIARGGVKHNGFMLKGGSVYVSGMLQSVTNADGHVCFGVTLALDGMGDGWAPLMSDCVLKSSKGTPYSLADVRLFPILQDDSLSYARLYLPNGRYEITPKAGCRMLADVKSAATSFTLCGATGLQIGNGTSGMKDLVDLGESDRAAGMVYDAASQVLKLGVGNFTLAGAGALDNALASIQLAKGNVGLTFSDKVITDGTVITGEITDDNATLTLSGGTVFRLGSVEVNALKITGGSIWIETLNAKSVTDGDGKPLFCVTVPDIVGAGENTVAVTAEAGTSFGNYKLDGLYARDEALSLWLPKGGYSFRVNDYLYQADVTTAAVTAERLAFGLTVNGEDLNRVRSDSWSWDVLSETLKLTGENVLSGSSRLGQVRAVVAADARLAFADVTCLSSLAVESGTTVLAGGTSVVTGAVTLAEGAGVAILGGSHNLAFAEDGAESVTDGCGRRVHCVTVDVGGADGRAVAVTGLGEYDVGGIRPVGGRLSLWLCDGYYEFSVDGRDFAAWIRGGATTARLVSGVRVTVGDETMDAAVGGADDKGWTYSPASGELFIFGKGADCALTGRAPQDLRVVQGADTTVRATDLVLAPRSGSPYALREGATNAVLQIGGACAFTAPSGAAGLCVPGDAALTVDRQFNSDPLAPDAVLEVTGGSRAAGIGSGLSGTVGEITIAGGTVVARGGEGAAGIGSDFMSPLTAPVARIRITGGTVVAHGGKGAAGIGCGLLGTGADIAISGGFVTAYGGEGAACIGWGASTQDNGSRVMIAISGGTVVCDARLGFAALGYGGDSADARCDITITGGSVNSWLNTASSGVDPRPRDAASNALYRVMLEVNEQEVRLNRRLTLSGLPADYLLSKIVPWRGSEDKPYVVTLYLPAGRYGNVSINGRQYVFTLSGADILTPVSARLGVTVDGVDGSLSPAGCAYDPVTRTLAITNTAAGGCVVSGGNAYGDVRIEQYPGTTVTLSNAAIAVMSTNGHPCCASPYRIRPGAKATLRLAGGNALTVSRDVDAAGLLVPEGASLVIEDADGSLAVNGHGRGAGIGGDGENALGELEIAGGCVSVDCYGEGAGIGGAGGHVKISGGLVSVWRTEPGGGAGIGTSAETRKARGVEIDITGGIVESRVYGCGGAGIGGGLNAPAACKIRISGGTVFAMGQTGECRIGGAGDFGAGENVPATDFGPGSLVISGGNVRGRYPYCKVDGGATDAEGRPVFCVETETGYAWEEFEGPLAVTVDAPYGTSDIYAQYDNPWVCLWLREGEHSFSVNGYEYEAEVTSFLDEPSPAFVRLVGVSVNGIDCGEGGDPEVTWGWYPKACALELPWGDVTYVLCGTNTSGDVQLVATSECARIEVGGILRLGGFGDRPALKGEFTMASGTLVIDGAPDSDAVCHVEGGSVLCDALAGQAFTAGVRPQRLYPIDFVIDGLKDVPMREVAVTGLNREVSGGLGGLVKYDLRNLYAVNGRICLWLTATREGTTYVFEADGVHYRATFANGAFAVVRDPAYITGIRCNGLDIGNGDGEGWEFEDGVLQIFDEGSFTLTGRNDGPVPVRGIVQTSAATVTLDGLSLELPADVTHAPYRLMVEVDEEGGDDEEDPIGATLLLKGENRLASAGASREITSGKAAVQIDPGVTLVIDRAEPEGVARLEARGAWGGAGIGGAYCAGGFGTIDIRGGEIVAQGGENAAGIGGGGSTSVPEDTTRTNGVIFIRGGVVRATGGAKGAGIGAGLNERIGIGIPIEISGGEIVAQGGENAAGLGGGDYSSAAAVVILGGTVDAHRGPDNGFSLAAPDDVGDGRMILTAETGPLVIRGGNLYCRSLEKDGRDDAAMTSVPSNGASRVWRVALDGIAGAVRAHGGDYGSRDVVPVDGRVCLWLPGGTYAFDADETPLDIRVDGETGACSVTTALTHAVEFPLNGLAVTVTDSLGAVLEPVLATNAQGEAVARLAVRDGVTLTLAFAPPVGSHLTGGATLTVGPVTADRSLSSEIPTHAPDELKFTVRAMSADRVASVDVAVLRNGETVAAASVTNGEGKVGVQYGDRVRLDVHPAPDSVFVGPIEHVVGTNDVAVNVKCLPTVLDYIGWSVTGEVACVASDVAYVTASTVRLEKGGWYAVADGTLALGTLELAGTANLILLDDTDLVVTGSTGRPAVTVARSGRLNVFASRSGGTGRLALAGGAGAAAVSGDLAVYGGTVVAQGGAETESAVDGEVVRCPKMILRLGESADRAAQSSNEFLLQPYVDFTEGYRLWFAGATMIECTRARTTQYIDHEIVHAGDLVQVWAAKDDVVDFEFAVMASFSEDCELMQDTLRYGPVTASAEITPPLLRPLRNKALTLRFDSHIAGITVTVTPPAGFGDAYTTSLRGTRLEGLGVGDQLTLVPECRTGYRSESQTLTVGFDGASAKFDSFPLPPARYRRWTESGFEDATVAAAPLDSGATAIGGDGWYVVTGKVTTATLKVNGTANLILADGATLTANSGIRVNEGNALNIYAQSEGDRMGKLVANGASNTAGIGGGKDCNGGTIRIAGGAVTAYGGKWASGIGGGYNAVSGGYGGMLEIVGGTVSATGGQYGAGIGGGDGGGGGTVKILGGLVTASSGMWAAGIGGGNHYNGKGGGAGTITISGGTVKATGNGNGADIGNGNGGTSGSVTITGGNVYATVPKVKPAPTNAVNEAVYCVTVAGFNDGEPVTIDGLENYGLKDIYPIDGNVYLYLPNGSYTFTVGDHLCSATVNGAATEAVTVVDTTSYLRWDGTKMVRENVSQPRVLSGSMTAIGSADGLWYVVTGEVTADTLTVNGTAHLILADGATLTVTSGIRVSEGNTLNVYAQSEGDEMGRLVATGAGNCAGIGGGNGEGSGTVKVHGGLLEVTGGDFASGIGGGNGGGGGEVCIYCGTVKASSGADANDIGAGKGGSGGTVTIVGGSVLAANFRVDPAPKNAAGKAVYCVTVNGFADGEPVSIAGLVGYNARSIRLIDGKVYLWLPIGRFEFTVDGRACVVNMDDPAAVPYLRRDGTETVVDTVANPTAIFDSTTTIGSEDGAWYVVRGEVTTGNLTVNGTAHLILVDDATLTANGDITGGTLVLYGQAAGTGQFVFGDSGASLSIEGGRLAAGTLGGEAVTVCGGTVTADAVAAEAVTIAGGSVLVTGTIEVAPTNAANEAVYCVTVDGFSGDEPVTITGLGDYGTHGICPVGGSVYLYLPDGLHGFSVDGKNYVANVSGAETSAVRGDLYRYWDGAGMAWGHVVDATELSDSTTTIGSADGAWYIVRGTVTTTDLKVTGKAHLILADGANLTANGTEQHAGITVLDTGALFLYGQVEGTGALEATGCGWSAGIGAGGAAGADHRCGTIVIDGGVVSATGGSGAGIGGCFWNSDVECAIKKGGTVTINGGRVTAKGGGSAAGIGGGAAGSGGTVTINGGTVVAEGDDADDIGHGERSASSGTVTIAGGSVYAAKSRIELAPRNAADKAVYCVTVPLRAPSGSSSCVVEGLAGYGICDLYPIDGKVYLYLPKGNYAFTVDGVQYAASVSGSSTTATLGGSAEVDYLDWDGSAMVSKTVKAQMLTGATTEIGGDGWYVVLDNVTTSNLKVNGTAHLILADGAKLTANGNKQPGIQLDEGHSLFIYGQLEGSGELEATGGTNCAGIGGNGNSNPAPTAGSLTINGGIVKATGDGRGAGIGGSDVNDWLNYGNGGIVTINGGRVTAKGRNYGAGIGGAQYGTAGTVTINGGTVEAEGGNANVDDIGHGLNGTAGGTVTIAGGSVLRKHNRGTMPKNAAGAAVYCVTVPLPVSSTSSSCIVEGLEGYGIRDIYPIEGKLYLYLPNGDYAFSVGGASYRASVSGGSTTAAVDGVEVDYLDWDGSAMVSKTVKAQMLTGATTEIGGDGWYVVLDNVTTSNLKVNGTAHLILADGAKLTANGSGQPGIMVQGTSKLVVYGQAGGTGALDAQGGAQYAGIGNSSARERCGTIVINGGVVRAIGGSVAAGIGGHDPYSTYYELVGRGGGDVTINGGRVTARSGGRDAAGIGGASHGDAGTVRINGGTVVAEGNNADDIGRGCDGVSSGTVTITGGSVLRMNNRGTEPKNAADAPVYCVTVEVGGSNAEKLRVEGLEEYGIGDIYPIEGKIYLFLPNGGHLFSVNGNGYRAKVADGPVTAVSDGIAKTVDYLKRNGAAMERATVKARVLTGEMTELDGDFWYVATGAVTTSNLKVNGTAHLILADGATLTVNGDITGGSGSLDVYGQDAGSGKLTVTGDVSSSLSVAGGRISVRHVSRLSVCGGTVEPNMAGESLTMTVDGGSVLTKGSLSAKNAANKDVYCVTVEMKDSGVAIEGLGEYGVHGIYPIDGKAYLWLPDGSYEFNVGDQTYVATVDGEATQAVSRVPYLSWNGTEMVPDRAYGVSALSDSATTIGSADGSWYVVTGSVTTATLTVNGTAHLILADGANLTATGGVRVTEGNTLNIYAQSEGEGMGRLIAKGGKRFAGIGGSAEAAGGTIIIHGGRVAATGGEFAAGIGGGRDTAGGTIIIHGGEVAARGFYGAGIGGGQNAPCGTVTINGGRVTASGAVDASSVIGGAGIGGGGQNAAGSITVNGGVVTATGGLRCAGLGCSYRGTGGRVAITGGTVTAVGGGSLDADLGGSDVAVTIDGGCVFGAKALVDPAPKNGEGLAVCLVTLDCPGAEGPVRVEGLKGYGTKDIYPIEGKVYLYLPAGRFTPTINGVTYDVIVFDSDTDRIPVDYIGLNGTTPVSQSAEAALVTENTEWIGTGLIGGAGWYVVTNDVTIFDLKVLGTANLILADGATLTAGGSDGTAIGEGHAGVEVGEGATLRIYAQAGGTGALRAVGSERGAGIGGSGNCSCGTVEIFGGRITAASGGSTGYGAGIGGGCFGDGGTVRIHAGTVIAVGGKGAEDIGGGYCGVGASVTVTGGSVYISESRIADAPVDGDGNGVWCVTVTPEAGTVAADEPVVIEGPDGYCTFGVFPFAGRLYLYLPNGDHDFGIGEFGYVASVKDAPTEARLAGPTCEDGTLVREGNDYRLVPDEGRSEVTVKGFPASAKLKVPPGVKTVRGVIATAVFVEGADGFDLSGAFRVFEMLGEELVGTSIRLNPDGEVLVDGEVVSVRPGIGGIFLSDDGFSVSVKTIPGLTYELKRASEPNGAFESVDVAVPATSGHTTLSDAQPPDGKAFYRVNLVWEEE